MMNDFIAVEITLGDGTVVRCGHDEADPENVPSGISFETSMPGGFSTGQVTLPRPANLRANTQLLFSPVRFYGRGGRTFYEGYVTGVSQTDTSEVQVQCSGWVTLIDRVQTFREIFVDRDLSRWGGNSLSRRLVLAGIAREQSGSFEVESDTLNGVPALTMKIDGAGTVKRGVEAWYDAGAGLKVASIYYSYQATNDTNFYLGLGVATDDAAGGGIYSGDLLGTATGSGTFTPSSASRYGILEFFWNAGSPWGADGVQYYATFGPLAVYGNHGLTKRGSAPQGFWASDIVRYALGQVPGLNIGTIETTSFVIPHLTFTEDTSIRSVIEQVTALGGNQNVPHDWGVYDNQTFFWQSPGTYGREWRVRKSENAVPVSDGPDADRRVAGIKISYTDPAGTTKTVGPPGSGADYETSQLLDADRSNPALKIPGIASEQMGITDQQGAINAGILLLNERNRLDWRGQVTVYGEVEDALGNPLPAAMMRAGDRIVVADDTGWSEPRTIAGTSYSHDSESVTCSIGAKPDAFESLLGQLAAVTDLIPG